MKVWHDDIRKPPEDWVWVRTNDEAIKCLLKHFQEITEMSLDHDLGLDYIDPDVYESRPEEIWMLQGDSIDGDGRDLVLWMISTSFVPPKLTVHSWNPPGAAQMATMFRRAGYECTVAPFNPATSWA